MRCDPDDIVESLRKMVAEEMFLLGQELEDSLDGGQQSKLAHLTASLDEATDVLSLHRRARPPIEPG